MNFKPYDKIPDYCVRITKDIASNTEMRIKINEEDKNMLPSYIALYHDDITSNEEMIIPSEWTELIKKKLDSKDRERSSNND